MDSSRRTLLAIVICVAIWIVYSTWIMPPPPAESTAPQQQIADERDDEGKKTVKEEDAAPANAADVVTSRLEKIDRPPKTDVALYPRARS